VRSIRTNCCLCPSRINRRLMWPLPIENKPAKAVKKGSHRFQICNFPPVPGKIVVLTCAERQANQAANGSMQSSLVFIALDTQNSARHGQPRRRRTYRRDTNHPPYLTLSSCNILQHQV
jgi:hypothetical protein